MLNNLIIYFLKFRSNNLKHISILKIACLFLLITIIYSCESFQTLKDVKSGVYPDEFYYEINTEHDLEYRYTLDGSDPIKGDVYSKPILIKLNSELKEIAFIPTSPTSGPNQLKYYQWNKPDYVEQKLVILKYQSFKAGKKASDVTTKHFYLDPDSKLTNNMPIISIGIDTAHLFNYETGIYVAGKTFDKKKWNTWWPPGNYAMKGKDWEKPANIMMIDTSNKIIFHEDAGIKINGFGICGFPQKTMRISFRKKYGNKKIKVKIFEKDTIQTYRRLLLRNSGQDFVGTFIRDVLLQSIAPSSLYIQNSKACLVYINGIFWGIHNIREKMDKHYIKSHFKLKENEYSYFENCGKTLLGDKKVYNSLMKTVNNKRISDSSYFKTLDSIINIKQWIDYLLFQLYIGNSDWPGVNVKLFKPNNGLWEWLTFDLDLAFGYHYIAHTSRGANFDFLKLATDSTSTKWPNPYCSTILIRQLLKNPVVKDMLLARSEVLLDSDFYPDITIKKIDSIKNIYNNIIHKQIERWGYPKSKSYWENEVDYLKIFAKKRPYYLKKQLSEYFGIPFTLNKKTLDK
jgi:hypothetical protein